MYSIDARKIALSLYEFFGSMRKAAKAAKVSASSISRWQKEILPKSNRKKRPTKLADVVTTFILKTISEKPISRCIDIAKLVNQTFNIQISKQLVHIVLKRHNISYKRVRKRGRSASKLSRIASFINYVKELQSDVRLISVDESGFDERVSPFYGYSKKGDKVILEYERLADRV